MTARAEVPKVIFDTDIGGDIDDLGALAVLHALADEGACEILGVAIVWSHLSRAQMVDAVNAYYGRPDIPVSLRDGEVKTGRREAYDQTIADAFPHDITAENVMTTTKMYREILAAQPDKSVTVATVGQLLNIELLLKSEPDAISPLNGIDLVAKKVKEFHIMGGQFPASGERPETNFRGGNTVNGCTKFVSENLPVPVVYNGFEVGTKQMGWGTGKRIAELPGDNPVRVGYDSFFTETTPDWAKREGASYGAIGEWSIWDQITVHRAVKGHEKHFDLVDKGSIKVEEDGGNRWLEEPDSDDAYVVEKTPAKEFADSVIEELMLRLPKAKQ